MEDKGIKVLIDLGMKYTKIGIIGEAEPRKILQTPELFNSKDFYEDTNPNINIVSHLKNALETKLSIEEFAYDLIINNVLQVRKTSRDKNVKCFFLIDIDLKDEIKEIFFSFIKYIYMTFPYIVSFKIIPKNICPIFVSSFVSGMILNCGYLYSTITVVDNGISIFSRHIGIGSCDIHKYLYQLITSDRKCFQNFIGSENIQENQNKLNSFKEKLVPHLDDILVRVSYVMSKKVSEEFFLAQKNKQINENYTDIYFYKDLPTFKIPFSTRVLVSEKLFGKNSENNLAFIIVNTLKENVPCEIRKKVASNIILSGGVTMLNGFYARMKDEVDYIMDGNNKELEGIKNLKEDINLHKIIFPRNCLAWIGGSLLLNFENLNFNGRELNRKEGENLNADIYDIDLRKILGIK